MVLGMTTAQDFNFSLNTNNIQIHVDDTYTIPFSLSMSSNYTGGFNLLGKSSDVNIASVQVPEVSFTFVTSGKRLWNDTITVKGVFLGLAVIELDIVNNDDVSYALV